ncbi:hypothetical protein Tco_1031815 [Tanacetum coccineum]|uniref:Uncharacterized protein n=1 Tax=Tanacetum coccineum TaxID=301880 RepID=A0ABQ5GBS7_9ASTR
MLLKVRLPLFGKDGPSHSAGTTLQRDTAVYNHMSVNKIDVIIWLVHDILQEGSLDFQVDRSGNPLHISSLIVLLLLKISLLVEDRSCGKGLMKPPEKGDHAIALHDQLLERALAGRGKPNTLFPRWTFAYRRSMPFGLLCICPWQVPTMYDGNLLPLSILEKDVEAV